MPDILRYSDEELDFFKENIEKALNKAKNDHNFLLEQIQDVSDARDGDADMMDDASNSNDLERLYEMASRQRNLVRDLENALLRIRNKSYGICIVTGELIDKRRLIAVPITTKSLAAKNAVLAPPPKKKEPSSNPVRKNKPPVIVSKIIRGKQPQVKSTVNPDDDFFDDELLDDDDILSRLDYDDSFDDTDTDTDLDTFVDPDSDED
jgi:RNA polymerase-binding transcription factor DksA